MSQVRDKMRTSLANYPESTPITHYKEKVCELLHLSYPLLTETEIAAAVDISISNHFKNTDILIDNNYKKKQINTDLLNLASYILDKEPIITSYGVLFNRHGTVPNPIYKMIDGFINSRKEMKTEMFKYPKGSEDFEKYNLLQLLLKIDANGFYGATGQYSCIYYNLYAAASTTTQGRSCNSAAALFFESFLNNNVPFASLNEMIEFIYNVLNEPTSFNIDEIINIHASISETFFHLMSTTGFGWIPDEDEMYIIWEILCRLNQEQLDRLFYKNNLFYFMDNKVPKQSILYILQKLKAPFMDPNHPSEEIKIELKAFSDLLAEFVYYDKQIIDRLEKMESLIRSVSIIQDTDSAIVSFDGWYRKIRDFCVGIPMDIKNKVLDAVSFIANDEYNTEESKVPLTDYSFINDDIIEVDRLIDPMVITPQDGLRYSIINILAYVVGNLVNDYMSKYAFNSNTKNDRPCLLTLKNEFLFKRILIQTDAKKHYASKVELQEGNIVPEKKSLDIKGMEAFVKSTTNPTVQSKLKGILYDDILNSESIDPIKVLKDIAKIEKEIFDSIANGEKVFFKPAKVKSISAYENPMRIQGIVASYAYNNLHEPGTESLDLNSRNSVDIIKVEITKKNIDKIQESYPYVYEKALELMNTKEYEDGIGSIALPLNEPVPGWVLPFIEYKEIINDNISGFPIESIGLYRGNDNNNSTNIISF